MNSDWLDLDLLTYYKVVLNCLKGFTPDARTTVFSTKKIRIETPVSFPHYSLSSKFHTTNSLFTRSSQTDFRVKTAQYGHYRAHFRYEYQYPWARKPGVVKKCVCVKSQIG